MQYVNICTWLYKRIVNSMGIINSHVRFTQALRPCHLGDTWNPVVLLFYKVTRTKAMATWLFDSSYYLIGLNT